MPSSVRHSPRFATLVAQAPGKRSRLKTGFIARMIGVFVLIPALFLIFVSIVQAVSAGGDIARSSFGSHTEQTILQDYLEEADLIRERYADVVYFSQDVNPDSSAVTRLISDRVQDLQGTYSVVSTNLETGERIEMNGYVSHTMASLAKLFVASLALDDSGSTASHRQAVYAMLHASDNDAFRSMIDRMGLKRINAYVSDLDLGGVVFDTNDAQGVAIDRYLQRLYTGEIFQRADSFREMISGMTRTTNEERIPASLPADVVVAHKIGTWDGNYHDAGIVYSPYGDYTITVMTSDARSDEAVSATRDISRILYEYWKIHTPITYGRNSTSLGT